MLQVGDEVEIVYEGSRYCGKRGFVTEANGNYNVVDIGGGKTVQFGYASSLKKVIEKLKVGDIVEILYECDVKGKRGNITRITELFYVKIEGKIEVFANSGNLKKIKKDICICENIFLFNNGCKCGFLERQKNANSKSKYSSRWQQAIKRLPGG